MPAFEQIRKTAKQDTAARHAGLVKKSCERMADSDYCSQITLTPFQAKLAINKPDDIYEQEADRVANEVLRMTQPSVQRNTEKEEDQSDWISRISGQLTNSPGFEDASSILKDGGQPLSGLARDFFEPRFGFNFSKVRIFNGCRAAESSQAIRANAFTIGNNIVFNKGQYNTETDSGRKLIAHELTHVIQQTGASGAYNHTSAIQRQESKEKDWFNFDYKLLPPELKLRLGSIMLQANTGSSELSFTRNLVSTQLGYSYGNDLFLRGSSRDTKYRLGYNPSSQQLSLGLGYKKFGFSSSVNPEQRSFGLGLNYGAPLLPMPSDLSGGYNRAESGVRDILGSLGNPANPIDWYSQHKESVGSVMDAIKTTSKISKAETGSFGAGLRFSYNPEKGILIYGSLQWIF